MKNQYLIIFWILIASIAEAAKVDNNISSECLADETEIGKRGLLKKLACIKRKSDGSGAYIPRNSRKNPTGSCAKDFEIAYSDVMADALSLGDDSAYATMREKLIMILNNLRAVQSQLSDDLEEFSPEERLDTIRSASFAFKSCKDHFEDITSSDWEWFFKMASSKNSVLKDRHRKIFQCHFNLVRLSLENCSQRYGIND